MKDLLVILMVFAGGLFIGLVAVWGYFRKLIQELNNELAYKRDEIDRLNEELFNKDEELIRYSTTYEGSITRDEYDKMQISFKDELKRKDKWVEEKKTQIKTLHKQLEESDIGRAMLIEKCEEQEEELSELREARDTDQKELAKLKNELFGNEPDLLYNYQESIHEREQEISELRGKIEELEEIIADDGLMLDYGQKNLLNFQHIELELSQIDADTSEEAPIPIEENKPTEDLADKAAADPNFPKEKLDIAAVKAAYATEIDDLTELKGIGDYTALKLNAIGIQNFKQISSLSTEDIKLVNSAIKFFPGRIVRDKWVEQAKAILAGRNA